mgnify:CR=1 FL=1
MKRLILIISILLPLQAFAAPEGNAVSKSRITAALSEIRNCPGAELVSLGRFQAAALRGVIRLAAAGDPDAREALRLMKGIHGITVLDFEDCSAADKSRISRRLDRALSGSEVLMEASDGGERMRIYALVDESTDTVRDFVLYAPSDCALICIFGSISMDAISKIVADND